MSASGTSISDASPCLLRRVAVCNGILSFVGVFLALYAYLNFSHPAVVLHSGKSTWTESVESYAFIFPSFQIALFVVPLFYSLRWQTFLQRAIEQEAKYKAAKPYMESMDSVLVYRCVCVSMIAFEVGAISMTLYRVTIIANIIV